MEIARQVARERRKVGRLVEGLHAPGFDPRELEQAVDELQQAHAVAPRELELRSYRRGREGARSGLLHGPQHESQWGAELVADVREEHGLRAVDLREGLDPAPPGLE